MTETIKDQYDKEVDVLKDQICNSIKNFENRVGCKVKDVIFDYSYDVFSIEKIHTDIASTK